MKTMNYLFLLVMAISCANCAFTGETKTSGNTSSAASQNTSNEQTAPPASGENTASAQNAAFGQDQQNTPEALVKDLYKTHNNGNGRILDGKNRKLLDKYFDKNL